MNLLPPQQKEFFYKDVFLRFLSVAGLFLVFWIFIFFAIALNIIFYLNIQIPALEARIAYERGTAIAENLEAAEKEITDLNTALIRIQKIRDKSTFDFARALRSLGALTPDGVSLRALTFQGDESISIVGHAQARDQAVSFKDTLEQKMFCSKVLSPLLVRETDVSFTFGCTLYDKE